jgi:hypothetical protein
LHPSGCAFIAPRSSNARSHRWPYRRRRPPAPFRERCRFDSPWDTTALFKKMVLNVLWQVAPNPDNSFPKCTEDLLFGHYTLCSRSGMLRGARPACVQSSDSPYSWIAVWTGDLVTQGPSLHMLRCRNLPGGECIPNMAAQQVSARLTEVLGPTRPSSYWSGPAREAC